MIKIFTKILANPLFDGIEFDDFEAMLSCIEGSMKIYRKSEIIQLAGNPVETIGIIVTGSVLIVREDADGRQHILTELSSGELFGEVFACTQATHSPVTVLATTSCDILHINYSKVISTCSSSCIFHQRLIRNMLSLIAGKNLMLNKKIEILSKRSTRDRLFMYFDMQRNGEKKFSIPYSRDELAAYLCVDRSAMSAELSKMQRDGLILYNRNDIEII